MSTLLPSFVRGGAQGATSNLITNERNGQRAEMTTPGVVGSRRASAPAVTSTTPTTISSEEWSRRLAQVNLSKDELNQLVMNYLVIEGYKDAAEKFSRETGIPPPGDLMAIEERMRVRNEIHSGNIDEAIDKINNAHADLLDSHPRIAFHLQQQRIIELIKKGKVEEALVLSQDELAPRAELHKEFLRELERTMSALVWYGHSTTGGKEVAAIGNEVSSRMKVANEVNAALLAVQCQEHESKLPSLLRLLHHQQEVLSGKMNFPKIIDYSSSTFKGETKLTDMGNTFQVHIT